jgi:hypothetical protein
MTSKVVATLKPTLVSLFSFGFQYKDGATTRQTFNGLES